MNNEESPAVRKANQHFRKEAQAREGVAAWKEYTAQEEATRQKTAKLKAQRLARDASAAVDDAALEATPTQAASTKSRTLRKSR